MVASALALLLAEGCCPKPQPAAPPVTPASPCPAELAAPQRLPGSEPHHRDSGFWIGRLAAPDAVVLEPGEIAALNQRGETRWQEDDFGFRRNLAAAPIAHGPVLEQLRRDIRSIRELSAAGKRVLLDGTQPPAELFDRVDALVAAGKGSGELRAALTLVPMRSLPMSEGLYEKAGDVDFDLMHASSLRAGELVQVVSVHPDGWRLVRSDYAYGWIQGGLSPAIAEAEARAYHRPERFVVVTADSVPVWASADRRMLLLAARIGLRLPLAAAQEEGSALVRVRVPSPQGLVDGWVARADVHEGAMPLTRRNLFRHAFRQLDDRFGWGGMEGDRDCSRFLLDLFALFGLDLPRNSAYQAESGSWTVPLEGLSLEQKGAAIDGASARGLVLAFMKGHIMLMIGKDDGRHFAIHQFSGYRVPCQDGPDTKMVVSRVAVSDLQLGEGSARKSFIERLTKLIIFGRRAE
ncbi:MAG: SH3 domain-containing protein [Deltaproteobacteria bacterium]|jgi:cell wall-associated NlpC family hydrolase|nr:SH3 domain-containing protein [Deltaproteobacteria bacterium]